MQALQRGLIVIAAVVMTVAADAKEEEKPAAEGEWELIIKLSESDSLTPRLKLTRAPDNVIAGAGDHFFGTYTDEMGESKEDHVKASAIATQLNDRIVIRVLIDVKDQDPDPVMVLEGKLTKDAMEGTVRYEAGAERSGEEENGKFAARKLQEAELNPVDAAPIAE